MIIKEECKTDNIDVKLIDFLTYMLKIEHHLT